MISTFDIEAGARTIAQEARGEPQVGQEAVAWTLRNRLEDGRWGMSISSVCLWHAQYSGWWCPRQASGHPYRDPNFAYACGLRDDDPVLVKMREILTNVLSAMANNDPTHGAINYYAISIPEPSWVDAMDFTVQIGRHRFYKEKGLIG